MLNSFKTLIKLTIPFGLVYFSLFTSESKRDKFISIAYLKCRLEIAKEYKLSAKERVSHNYRKARQSFKKCVIREVHELEKSNK